MRLCRLALGPLCLRKPTLTGGMLFNPNRHRNIGAPGLAQQPVEQARPQRCISPGRGDAQDLQLRAGKRKPHGESVIDVVADIGVDDDELGRRDLSTYLG